MRGETAEQIEAFAISIGCGTAEERVLFASTVPELDEVERRLQARTRLVFVVGVDRPPGMDDLLFELGVELASVPASSEDSLDPSRGRLEVPCRAVPGHGAVAGIRRVMAVRACEMSVDPELTSAVLLCRRENIFGAWVSPRGQGHAGIVVVSVGEAFSRSWRSTFDNAHLLARLLGWARYDYAQVDAWSELLLKEHAGLPRHLNPAPFELDASFASAELMELAKAAPDLDVDDPLPFLRHAALTFTQLPVQIRQAVLDFRKYGNAEGCLLIRGLPVDPELPPTPKAGGLPRTRATSYAELWTSAITETLGGQVGYLQEKGGALYQDIVPRESKGDTQTSESFSTLLQLHTETAFHPHKPDYVSLFCLRGDHDGKAATVWTSVPRIMEGLECRHIQTLYEHDRFAFEIDESFGNESRDANGRAIPVLQGARDDPHMVYDQDMMKAPESDEEARAASAALLTAAKSSLLEVVLKPGDLLVLANRKSIHGRSNFTPRWTEPDVRTNRWLLRAFAVVDLGAARRDLDPHSRIIGTTFTSLGSSFLD